MKVGLKFVEIVRELNKLGDGRGLRRLRRLLMGMFDFD